MFKAAFFKALAHPIRIRILERLVRPGPHRPGTAGSAAALPAGRLAAAGGVARPQRGVRREVGDDGQLRGARSADWRSARRRAAHLQQPPGRHAGPAEDAAAGAAGPVTCRQRRHGLRATEPVARLDAEKVRSYANFPAVSPERIGGIAAVLARRRGRWTRHTLCGETGQESRHAGSQSRGRTRSISSPLRIARWNTRVSSPLSSARGCIYSTCRRMCPRFARQTARYQPSR